MSELAAKIRALKEDEPPFKGPWNASVWNSALERAAALAEAQPDPDALVAAAYEAAAKRFDSLWHETSGYRIAQVRALTTADAIAERDRRDERMRAEGRIEAGAVFVTSGAEDRYVADQENACPACGGSGHKDDADEIAAARAFHDEQMRAEGRRAGMLAAAAIPYDPKYGADWLGMSAAILAAAEKEADHG